MAQIRSDLPTIGGSQAGRTALLIGGDVIAFLVFAAIGRRSHGEAAGLDALFQVAATAAPFIAGWLAVAPFVGSYRQTATSGVGPMFQRTLLTWLLAWPLGLLLRALLLQRDIPQSFAIVVLITNTILLGGWRLLFAWLEARRSTTASERE